MRGIGRRFWAVGLWLCFAALPLSAAPPEGLIQAREEIPEELLLDVSIELFDSGLPEGAAALKLDDEGLFDDVREAEARYIPVRLMETLQGTAQWGAVRVVPPDTGSAEVVVRGEIVDSNGVRLIVRIQAEDARGRVWFDRRYKEQADIRAYLDDEEGDKSLDLIDEPFQNLYHQVANDLLKVRAKHDREELLELRDLARLRFAADVAPLAFDEYLGRDRRGRPMLARLPAADDPMLERVDRVRERDYLLVDTLSEYYATFEARMSEPYSEWRRMSYEEEMARRKIKRQARTQKILGALAILGGIVAESEGNGSGIGEVAIVGGALALQGGIARSQEAKIHVEALRELAASLDAEMRPLLVDVEGETLRLTGTAETQYLAWRKILRDIFLEETGLPVDPDDPSRLAGVEED